MGVDRKIRDLLYTCKFGHVVFSCDLHSTNVRAFVHMVCYLRMLQTQWKSKCQTHQSWCWLTK